MGKPKRQPMDSSFVDEMRGIIADEGSDRAHPAEHFIGVHKGDFKQVPVGEITAGANPRKHFDPDALEELTESVRSKGVIQPITVMPNPAGSGFIIIAGERRWRAAKNAGLVKIPAMIRDEVDDLEIALIENVQRQDLTPFEQAAAYQDLKEKRGYSDEEVAKAVGKKRSTVTEILSLNQIPEELRDQLSVTDKVSKTLILQALRRGGLEKVQSLLTEERKPTTLDLRKKKDGRPKNHQETHRTHDGVFRITVTASRPKVDPKEVKAALLEIADGLA